MKILKYIFLLLLLSAIAGAVFIATQNGKYDISEERVIQVPKNVLYNYVNDYKNWENSGILTGSDTTAVFTFPETTYGQGASASWKLNEIEGTIKTVKLIENDSIFQKAVIDNEESDVTWAFKDTLNATKVTIRMKGTLTFTEKAYSLIEGGVEEKMEDALEKGLTSLNSFLVDELKTFDVKVHGIVSKTGTFYIGQNITCKISQMDRKLAEAMPKLTQFVKDNKMVTNGNPFTLFKRFDETKDSTNFIVCVPLKEEMFTTPGSEFEGGRIQSFNALKTTLKGDYSHLKKAWNTAHKHIADNQLAPNASGMTIEVYTKNIQNTKKPSHWITDIYIPIGDATPIPPPVIDTTQVVPPVIVPIKASPLTKPAGGTGTVAPTGSTIKPAAQKTAGPTNTGTKPATTSTGTKPTAAKPTNGTTPPKQ